MSNDDDRSRLDSEWVTANAVRELISLATQGDSSKSTYNRALELGAAICPDILGEDVSVIRRFRESDTAREYRQKAQAKSLKEEAEITPVDLLKADIEEYSGLLATARNQQRTDRLKRRLDDLKRALVEIDPERHSENQLIFRDAYNVSRDIPELKTGKAHRDFRLPDDDVLRIRVFHPDNPERITGADLVYEKHDPEKETVNLAAIQYKIWEDKTLYLNDDRMNRQLDRMRNFFCGKDLCVAGQSDHTFRFPYCSAFLRPTDRLQSADQRLHSTGEHIPICQLETLATDGPRGGRCITYDGARSVSLSHGVFESLLGPARLDREP